MVKAIMPLLENRVWLCETSLSRCFTYINQFMLITAVTRDHGSKWVYQGMYVNRGAFNCPAVYLTVVIDNFLPTKQWQFLSCICHIVLGYRYLQLAINLTSQLILHFLLENLGRRTLPSKFSSYLV